MPANSDHLRRDAISAAQHMIAIDVKAVSRRLNEAAKASIEKRIADAQPGEIINGKQLGLEAAEAALAEYVIDDESFRELSAEHQQRLLETASVDEESAVLDC